MGVHPYRYLVQSHLATCAAQVARARRVRHKDLPQRRVRRRRGGAGRGRGARRRGGAGRGGGADDGTGPGGLEVLGPVEIFDKAQKHSNHEISEI